MIEQGKKLELFDKCSMTYMVVSTYRSDTRDWVEGVMLGDDLSPRINALDFVSASIMEDSAVLDTYLGCIE